MCSRNPSHGAALLAEPRDVSWLWGPTGMTGGYPQRSSPRWSRTFMKTMPEDLRQGQEGPRGYWK